MVSYKYILYLTIILSTHKCLLLCKTSDDNSDYWERRQEFINNEKTSHIGGELTLSPKEELVNNHLMTLKYAEYDNGVRDPTTFLPSINFLLAQPLIEQSKLFQLIKLMPKGAVLHAHDSALASEDIIYNLTFMDNLYFCNTTQGQLRFIFASTKPTGNQIYVRNADDCDWKLLSEERQKSSDVNALNQFIRSRLTLKVDDPLSIYKDCNLVWQRFSDIFSTVIPLVTYRPALETYWYQAFKEYYDDNVMYIEFRGTLPPAYELNGTIYNEIQVAGMYRKMVKNFKKDYPDFHGARFIYAPYRKVMNSTFDNYLRIMNKLHAKYPDFVAGFDLVGQEDMGEPLVSFVSKILELPMNIRLFFHAGETNWYGEADMNLIDAILLGTYRIGHGFALYKHPMVQHRVKDEHIAIEVNPISNQVLRLVDDLRNHPAAGLFADNYPVVISNDDPAFWGAKGLSYDFYVAFMAFTSREADIRVLKQLAMNSIHYSAMPIEEQGDALNEFNKRWNNFIDTVLLQLKSFNEVI